MNRDTAVDFKGVPDREDLLNQLQQANQYTWLWIVIRLAAIAALIALISWQQVVFAPIVSVTACLVILGPFMMELAQIWGKHKKRLEDVKESTRFGDLDKHSLRSLYQNVLKRLQLPDDHLPVYITNDKSLNAGALRLGRLFGGLNGIYLNRQVLHKLQGEEVQAIMGHELGHYYKFNVAGDRFRLLTLVLGALVGVYAVQIIQLDGFLGFIVMSGVSGFFWYISSLDRVRHGQAIEYLCDDFGAQVNGIEASISGLLKVGLDSETRFLIELELMAVNADNELLTPQEISQAIEKATPYGHTPEPELYDSIRLELRRKAKANQQASISGFIKYMWESDRDDEDLKEELQARAKAVNQIDRMDWETVWQDHEHSPLHLDQVERLVQMIAESPKKSLFRIPESLSSDGIHPPMKLRILYLWKNRNSPTKL
ncbi:Protease HtpX [Rubripirellula amarantea]|uniref:Protease HtpX n=1 Tax=Rubripirellula amarantea TaxID=2527999 RepID=A0A5C5WM82_9BACT|nr:M48 family metalloprotease [Rubripirellula amarantea]TWT51285.1 Protease HtpX [Rubripirellula amarantea]